MRKSKSAQELLQHTWSEVHSLVFLSLGYRLSIHGVHVVRSGDSRRLATASGVLRRALRRERLHRPLNCERASVRLEDIRVHCKSSVSQQSTLQRGMFNALCGSQKGTRSTRFGKRVAQPWMNLLNCFPIRQPPNVRHTTQTGTYLRDRLNKVRRYEVRYPLRRLLAILRLQLHLEHTVLEELLVLRW